MSPRAWWRVHRARLLQLWGVGIACSLLVRSASALVYLEFLQARTLELLLGRVYERVGLKDLAAEAFAEARLRSTRHP